MFHIYDDGKPFLASYSFTKPYLFDKLWRQSDVSSLATFSWLFVGITTQWPELGERMTEFNKEYIRNYCISPQRGYGAVGNFNSQLKTQKPQ